MNASVSGITGNSGYVNPSAPSATQRQSGSKALQQLAKDLKAGNLSGARSDFANFQNSFAAVLSATNGQSANGTTTGSAASAISAAAGGSTSASPNPLTADLQSLSQALQSGNITAAQGAFAKLQSDAQSAQQSQVQGLESHHHHHHHGGANATSGQANGQANGQSGAQATGTTAGTSSAGASLWSGAASTATSGGLGLSLTA